MTPDEVLARAFPGPSDYRGQDRWHGGAHTDEPARALVAPTTNVWELALRTGLGLVLSPAAAIGPTDQQGDT